MRSSDADNSRRPRGPGAAAARVIAARLGAFFRPSQLDEVGVGRHRIRSLLRAGSIERVRRGLYRVAGAEPTQDYSLALACARIPRGIVCLLSALRVHGIGTQAPSAVWLAIPHKARRPRLKGVALRIVRFSGRASTLGVVETAFEGVRARVTGSARTVVDCFRLERLVGPEAAMEALQDALRRRKVTVAELGRMEEAFPSRRLRAALDVRSI
jgi:predicted transcriptional regulator of viral defense system